MVGWVVGWLGGLVGGVVGWFGWVDPRCPPRKYIPSLALDPEVAYAVMSLGMREGLFTGVGLGAFINATACDYVNARQIINRMDRAALIAGYAQGLEAILVYSSEGGR